MDAATNPHAHLTDQPAPIGNRERRTPSESVEVDSPNPTEGEPIDETACEATRFGRPEAALTAGTARTIPTRTPGMPIWRDVDRRIAGIRCCRSARVWRHAVLAVRGTPANAPVRRVGKQRLIGGRRGSVAPAPNGTSSGQQNPIRRTRKRRRVPPTSQLCARRRWEAESGHRPRGRAYGRYVDDDHERAAGRRGNDVAAHRRNGAGPGLRHECSGTGIRRPLRATTSTARGRRVASSTEAPLYYSAGILRDGRVIYSGGEYDEFTMTFLETSEIYDPVANTWTLIPAPPGWTAIGDSPGCVLPDGRWFVGRHQHHADGDLRSGDGDVDGGGEQAQQRLRGGLVAAARRLDPVDRRHQPAERREVHHRRRHLGGRRARRRSRSSTASARSAPRCCSPTGGCSPSAPPGSPRCTRRRRSPTSPARGSPVRRSRRSTTRPRARSTHRRACCRTAACCSPPDRSPTPPASKRPPRSSSTTPSPTRSAPCPARRRLRPFRIKGGC